MSRHVYNLELTLYCKRLDCDIDVEVSYTYDPGCPATRWTPKDEAEISILNIAPISDDPEEQDIELDDFDLEEIDDRIFDLHNSRSERDDK